MRQSGEQHGQPGGRNHAPAGQPIAEQFAPLGDSSTDGRDRAPEGFSCLGVRLLLYVAQDHRLTVLFRQPADFLVQRDGQFGVDSGRRGNRGRRVHRNLPPPLVLAVHEGRRSSRDLMDPGPERPPVGQAFGLLGEGEERGLEGIFGVLRASQRATANAPNEGRKSFGEGGERRLIARRDVPIQQLGFGLRT